MVPYRIRVIVFDAAQPLCHIGLNTLYGCWHVPAITASGGWRVVLVARFLRYILLLRRGIYRCTERYILKASTVYTRESYDVQEQ